MNDRVEVTRREVNLALLVTAIAAAGAVRLGQSDRAKVHLFDFAIAGGRHHALERRLPFMKLGDRLRLAAEADNPHDGDAVAVLDQGGVRLGYVPRAANSPIARLLERNEQVTAEIIGFADFKKSADVPDSLVFTAVISGDPIIRLTGPAPA